MLPAALYVNQPSRQVLEIPWVKFDIQPSEYAFSDIFSVTAIKRDMDLWSCDSSYSMQIGAIGQSEGIPRCGPIPFRTCRLSCIVGTFAIFECIHALDRPEYLNPLRKQKISFLFFLGGGYDIPKK